MKGRNRTGGLKVDPNEKVSTDPFAAVLDVFDGEQDDAFADAPDMADDGPDADPFSEDAQGEGFGVEGVAYTDDIEADAKAEIGVMSEALKSFKGYIAETNQRKEDATDSEFWCALVFETREQKEEALRVLGVGRLDGDKYIDGAKFAERISGKKLNSRKAIFIKPRRDDRLASISRPLP